MSTHRTFHGSLSAILTKKVYMKKVGEFRGKGVYVYEDGDIVMNDEQFQAFSYMIEQAWPLVKTANNSENTQKHFSYMERDKMYEIWDEWD